MNLQLIVISGGPKFQIFWIFLNTLLNIENTSSIF